MSYSLRQLTGHAALVALLMFAAPSQAQTLDISFVGSVFNCIAPNAGLNQSVNLNFTASGQTSGSDTIITVNLGSSLGSFTENVPTAQIEELAQALAASGGSIQVNIGPIPIGPPPCDLQGTLTISLAATFEQNAPGNLATTTAAINSFVRTTLPAITNRINSAFRKSASFFSSDNNVYTVSGMSAGDGDRPPIGAWAGYSFTDSSNDFTTTAFSSDRHTAILGLDTMPSDNLLLGLSVSLERAKTKTRFNSGEQNATAISVTPYAGYLLSDWLTLDAALGFGSVSTDQFRTLGATRISSDLHSTRIYGSLNATGTWAFDRLLASSRVGFLYATQDDDRFLESNGAAVADSRAKVGRLLLGGELAYSLAAWEPYVSGTFEHDFTSSKAAATAGVAQPKNDDTDLLFAVGLRYYGKNDLSGSLEYNTILGRRNLEEDNFSANVRWKF